MLRRNVKIFGIVNLTEDSFSDGGLYLNPDKALDHALELSGAGADVIDLGAASSHPEAKEVSASVEIERLAPVLKTLSQRNLQVSVDSWRPEVQRWAIGAGATWLNDINGFGTDKIYDDLAQAGCGLIAMHSLSGERRATRQRFTPAQVLESVFEFFDERLGSLSAAGIDENRIVLDPGMGLFLGSDAEASLAVLRNIGELKQRFDLPVMISVSRKSVIASLTGRALSERGAGSLAAELYAIEKGATCIRTHDPGALNDALMVLERLRKA